jgi:WD40 repeat protein
MARLSWIVAAGVMVGLALLLGGRAEAQQQKISAKAPGGDRVASASNKAISVFDAQTGKLLMKIQAFKNDVSALLYSPDGKLLGAADKEGNVALLDAATGKMVWKAKALPGVNVLSFSADGKKVTAKAPGGAETFDASTGKKVK